MTDVSVIIPVYNSMKTLEKCVESLIYGKFSNPEIILVDDCSCDGSSDLCDELAARFPSVRCIHSEENRGVSHSRNLGLDAVQTPWVCFVDSDDWVSAHFIADLLSTARQESDALVLCGMHYLNMVDDFRQAYLWGTGGTVSVDRDGFFDLNSKLLLGQVWNKIFRQDVIESHHLRFDERQSMGEDFQFVLEYLRAGQIRRCVVLDRPLYYYTRTTTTSLMSRFGHDQREQEYSRLHQLLMLTGNTAHTQAQYHRAVQTQKGAYVYHCLRHSKAPKSQQLQTIREITGEADPTPYYRSLQQTKLKELPVLWLRRLRQKLAEKRGNCVRKKNAALASDAKAKLTDPTLPVTLISQNCIGGVLYKDVQQPYRTPTAGLYFTSSDFIRFVLDLDRYLAMDLQMRWEEEYPIGTLGDVQIHFLHYSTCREAKEKWLRRSARILRDRIVVICTDRDGFSDTDFQSFQTIPYPKVLITGNKAYRYHPDALYLPEYWGTPVGEDVITTRKFYRNSKIVSRINAICQ